jgi:hypothetical protein
VGDHPFAHDDERKVVDALELRPETEDPLVEQLGQQNLRRPRLPGRSSESPA